MIVLIAPEQDVSGEIELLHQVFQEGLTHYHVRKPAKNRKEYSAYLAQIDVKYHKCIVIHQYHELINSYDLKGIHLQEKTRRAHIGAMEEYLENLNSEGKTISSSFHYPQELADCPFPFDYHLLSPVFTSISKKDYKGQNFDVNHIPKNIIGMGGVNAEKLPKLTELGFKGAGVLGGLWNSKLPIEEFQKMKDHYYKTEYFN